MSNAMFKANDISLHAVVISEEDDYFKMSMEIVGRGCKIGYSKYFILACFTLLTHVDKRTPC